MVTTLLVQSRLSAQSAPRAEAQEPQRPAWVVTGGVRQQYEHFTNEDWGAAPPDSNGYLLQRYMFRIDRRVAPWAMAAIETKSGIELGRTGGPRLPDEDVFDLHQGFVDLLAGS